MTKTKADRATDIYESARENPYVQRLIEDEELRDSLRDAFEAAKGAYGRAAGFVVTVAGIGLLLALVGAALALAFSEDARKTVLDALFGAEEEFEYTSTTSINGS